ncbi:MAG: DUF599 family protein [Proteobacteria bacterium]|nr:DUF599 family protein [Pseudomonadota bacterium]MDA1331649.1 DUF599 family protein [Pseudomonadota bacterium]
MTMDNTSFTVIDYLAIAIFYFGWVGYAKFARRAADKGMPSLMSVMVRYREQWWRGTIRRDLKIVDANIILTLANGATFFASTTILILGALLALLGNADRVIMILADLPFAVENDTLAWNCKIVLLLAIFIYAFFKFTWSLRQHFFCSVMVGAAPDTDATPDVHEQFIQRGSKMASIASNTFNDGLRAYYFGLSVLPWFLNAWLFILSNMMVIGILYHREFKSDALKAMLGNDLSKGSCN